MALTVTATAPPELLADAARRAAALADRARAATCPTPGRCPSPGSPTDSVPVRRGRTPWPRPCPSTWSSASCNPVALPITVEFDPPKAIGRAVFTAPYEGAPGCVHGAVLAGAFDIMLTAANVIADGAGPTVNLSIRYLKPTLIGAAGPCSRPGSPSAPSAGPTAGAA